jgi:uncharacterized protein (DUF1501 family)
MERGIGFSRRAAIKAGLFGLSGLTAADWLRAREAAASTAASKAVILIWLDGGPSQLESYDPKPDAPAEYRGPFGAVSTSVPGVHVSELLPRQAKLMHKLALVRTLHHDNGDHFAAAHWMLTGCFGATAANLAQQHPSIGSYVARIQGPRRPSAPAYVGLPAAQSVYLFPGYQGAAYLGRAYEPFDVQPEQKYIGCSYGGPILKPKFLETLHIESRRDVDERARLIEGLDHVQRSLDAGGAMASSDAYQQQALEMLLSRRAREAFDMEREDLRVRDAYGPGPWGHYACMARRLVEAGVRFVTVDMPHWDHHSNLEKGHGANMRAMDQAVGALIEDLDVRGMLDEVLVLVMGEFGRTPRINQGLPNDPVPGRDHWGQCFCAMLAGGGVRGGQAVGTTNPRAEYPIERPLRPGDLLATVYRLLGIDPEQTFNDHAGRPRSVLSEGEVVPELLA